MATHIVLVSVAEQLFPSHIMRRKRRRNGQEWEHFSIYRIIGPQGNLPIPTYSGLLRQHISQGHGIFAFFFRFFFFGLPRRAFI
ncbi:hypothetical protein HBH53_012760 [Parastagonospora nodorum]|nr:hypothetical protein HBH53_012760 [Parastagonospora nodorum]KAH5033854.1 hypothetical protein HBI74_072600 [Parastagonospora nodorum]KAH5259306.1 hypothetical protein HBI71_115050 [Parastagonospora nodorum]KAH5378750.1 hypothetical protein HBI49_027340 [Parastagonospora nodorum]KAH5657162.1 hypothetical protein HBI51_029800 [Parastagonospora nodorum]